MEPLISHTFVYGRVRKNSRNSIIDRKGILKILRWYIRLPGPHQLEFLKEMEDGITCKKCGNVIFPSLLRKVSRDKYEVLKPGKLQVPKDFYGNPLWS